MKNKVKWNGMFISPSLAEKLILNDGNDIVQNLEENRYYIIDAELEVGMPLYSSDDFIDLCNHYFSNPLTHFDLYQYNGETARIPANKKRRLITTAWHGAIQMNEPFNPEKIYMISPSGETLGKW